MSAKGTEKNDFIVSSGFVKSIEKVDILTDMSRVTLVSKARRDQKHCISAWQNHI